MGKLLIFSCRGEDKLQRAFCLGFLVFSWKPHGEVGLSGPSVAGLCRHQSLRNLPAALSASTCWQPCQLRSSGVAGSGAVAGNFLGKRIADSS